MTTAERDSNSKREPPIKLLMLSHYFDSHRGGIEFVARELFRRHVGPDCEITWAAAAISAPPACGDRTSALPLTSWNGLENAVGVPFPVPSPSALRQLWSAVRRSDVVLLHDCLYLANIAAFLFARLLRLPVVIVQHTGKLSCSNPLVNTAMAAATSIITRSMLRFASQVVFISGTTLSYFDRVRYRHEPLLIFNGVDMRVFHPLTPGTSNREVREALGLPLDPRVALFVGRFVQSKGLHVLEHMARMAPDITWTFAGSGPSNPAAWGLVNVRVYSDLDHHTLADLYRASDVLLLPSLREGFPLVIQEALACGLPVICTADIATADEALLSVVRGVPLTAGDDHKSAQDFLAAINDVLPDDSTRHESSLRSDFARHRYSWERSIHQYADVVRELIANRKKKACAHDSGQDDFVSAAADTEDITQ